MMSMTQRTKLVTSWIDRATSWIKGATKGSGSLGSIKIIQPPYFTANFQKREKSDIIRRKFRKNVLMLFMIFTRISFVGHLFKEQA